VEGREELSRHFEVDLLLVRWGSPLTPEEIASVVGRRCTVALGAGEGERVHGIVSHLEQLDAARTAAPRYVARIVPEVSLLELGRRSAVHQECSVTDLVTRTLAGYGLELGEDLEILVAAAAKSPKREYVVQYQESDWAFLSRWLEHEGLFTWVRHDAERAVLVVADENRDGTELAGGPIAYRERNSLSMGERSSLWNLRVLDRHVPRRATVVDYNHRKPSDLVVATATVDRGGFGHVVLYGDHAKDATEAAAVARVRAEELGAPRRTVRGQTDCAAFRVGHVFELERHPQPALDAKYLLTKVRYRVGHPVPALSAGEIQGAAIAPEEERATPRRFTADFEAQPLDLPFRPARTTPWPSIHGIMHGHVDGDTSGDVAEIDDQGRYKVRLPFAVGGAQGLHASRWIRKAQSYAGQGYGMHFPLHKGTEVLLAHVDGDPDRPIIVGAVPHATTPGPVARSNATQSVIQTASGIRLELEDVQG
jgi:type VI secretion system secreted protein VgrG